jgi:hypothetical protein
MSTINIAGLDKAEVLLALYHRGQVQGLGALEAGGGLSYDKAKEAVEHAAANAGFGEVMYFDYLLGRVIKTEIGHDELDPRLYDRDNGHGAAKAALAHLLKE